MTRRLIASAAVALLAAAPAVTAGDVEIDGSFVTNAPTGTAPLDVSSTTLVGNLNADRLDGLEATAFSQSGHSHEKLAPGSVPIDQDAALAGGVTSGDAAGFPVTLSEPGSYHLISNLSIANESNPQNVTVIEITTDAVTMDLNGYALLGTTSCDGTPVTQCDPTGNGIGVEVGPSEDRTAVTVRNGTVKGMGEDGVECAATCVVEKVRAVQNGTYGISINSDAGAVRACVAYRNGNNGIWSQGNVTGSLAQANGADGIRGEAVVRGNSSYNNGQNGIQCTQCVMINNNVQQNAANGAELSYAAWGGNLLYENGTNVSIGLGGAVEVDTNVCGTGASGVSACP